MDRISQEMFQASAKRLMRSYYEAAVKARDQLCAKFPDVAVEVLWRRTSIDVRNTKAEPEASAQIELDTVEQTLSIFLPKYAGKKDLVVRVVITEDGEATLAVVRPPPPQRIATYLLLSVCFPELVQKFASAECDTCGGDAAI